MLNSEEIIVVMSFAVSVYLLFSKRSFISFEIAAVISVILHGLYLFGIRILLLIFIITVVSTIVELVSLKTKYNFFGVRYSYNLSHKTFESRINLLNVYPIEIMFAWIIFKYLSITTAGLLVNYFMLPAFLSVLIASGILVSIDFVIDPISVKRKLWKWEKGSSYFGIPISNFVGWLLVGFISSVIHYVIIQQNIYSRHWLMTLPVITLMMIVMNGRKLWVMDKSNAVIGTVPLITVVVLSVLSLR